MWAYESVFYQIYPIGFCGAPRVNDGITVPRIRKAADWAEHIARLGCNAVYFSPIFESDSHGYDTRDFRKVDCRLGTNADFAAVCETLHEHGIKVVLDGVSVPASSRFFAFDMPIRRINGYYRRFDNTMETAARLGLRDIEPGMLPFTVVPQELHRVVESDAAKRFTSSPYQASKFNPQAFNKWEGYDYDKAEWSKIFKC